MVDYLKGTLGCFEPREFSTQARTTRTQNLYDRFDKACTVYLVEREMAKIVIQILSLPIGYTVKCLVTTSWAPSSFNLA
jgi:hypothetical protein